MKRKNIFLLLVVLLSACSSNTLPKATPSESYRGVTFGVDKNINEETIDNYLSRDDTIYRDMRMLKDPANYEAIAGDSYLSGIVSGFEVVPYPYIAPVSGLPESVGKGYEGDTLFSYKDGHYIANYKESKEMIEKLFPSDKYIFLMCGGGGYASMMKSFLVDLGYNEDKIYNVGGYWFYYGNNGIDLKVVDENNSVTYDYSKIIYHEINNFETYTKL